MQSIIHVVVCGQCGNGVFLRTEGDVRSCGCEYITLDSEGVHSGAEKDYEVFPRLSINKTEEQLAADFEEFNDKFGVFKDGKKMVDFLTKGVRKGIGQRRHFEDGVEDQLSLAD